MPKAKKEKTEYYISLDIESDGPCPGVNSMLQIGAVFYDASGRVLLEYEANMEELEGASPDPNTMAWWAEQEKANPGTWTSMMVNRVPAQVAIEGFQKAVERINKQTGGSPVVFAYPAGFDFTFLYYYLCRFFKKSCVGFGALDLKTLGMSLVKSNFRGATKRNFPSRWFDPALKHTHNALEDARGQGYMMFRMLEDMRCMK
jgi:DNA polymerase III alpha subunit (gram-positive type)